MPIDLPLQGADRGMNPGVVLVSAVAEVQPEYVSTGQEQGPERFRGGAGRSDSGDYFRVALAEHGSSGRMAVPSGDENGTEIVDVGQRWAGDDLIAQGLEEAVTVVVG